MTTSTRPNARLLSLRDAESLTGLTNDSLRRLIADGKLPVIAYRFNNIAYATDLNFISDETIEGLRDLDVLILDCVRIKPHATHLGLNEALEYIEKIKPKRAFLTHLNHDVLFERDSKLLPSNVEFSYDGLVIE